MIHHLWVKSAGRVAGAANLGSEENLTSPILLFLGIFPAICRNPPVILEIPGQETVLSGCFPSECTSNDKIVAAREAS